jgi:hypothetical protein
MKQLYEPLTRAEIKAMTPAARADRLALTEHQLSNKEQALQWMDPKPYMLAEIAGLRANITILKRLNT